MELWWPQRLRHTARLTKSAEVAPRDVEFLRRDGFAEGKHHFRADCGWVQASASSNLGYLKCTPTWMRMSFRGGHRERASFVKSLVFRTLSTTKSRPSRRRLVIDCRNDRDDSVSTVMLEQLLDRRNVCVCVRTRALILL